LESIYKNLGLRTHGIEKNRRGQHDSIGAKDQLTNMIKVVSYGTDSGFFTTIDFQTRRDVKIAQNQLANLGTRIPSAVDGLIKQQSGVPFSSGTPVHGGDSNHFSLPSNSLNLPFHAHWLQYVLVSAETSGYSDLSISSEKTGSPASM
jgi:hypothetical protein